MSENRSWLTRLRKRVQKEEKRTVDEHDFPTLAEASGGKYVIKDNPPLIYHHQLLNLTESRDNIRRWFARYRENLPDDRKVRLDRFQLMDLALKVVGVGSVGTLCSIALMMAADVDPLFLQIREAGPSVLGTFQ